MPRVFGIAAGHNRKDSPMEPKGPACCSLSMFASPTRPPTSRKRRSTTCRLPSATTSSSRCSARRDRAKRPCSTSWAAWTITTRETWSSTAFPPSAIRTATGTPIATTESASCSRPTTSFRIKPSWKTSSWRSLCRASVAPNVAAAPSTRLVAWGLPTTCTRSPASFPAVRCSASPSPARSSTTRKSCLPTSRRARSTAKRASRSWTCSPK